VLGFDREPHYLNQAHWAARQFGLSDKIEFRDMQVYEAARMNETFDLVVFMGLFYHLRYPLLVLDGLAQRVRRLMLFQSLTMPDNAEYLQPERELTIDEREPLLEPGWPKMAFFENGFAGDRTNWWAPNHSCIEAVLRTCGLRVTARPGHEMYFCEPNPQQPGCAVSWNREEFEAASGVSAAVRR
jgi:tRNA (mo5U34)-methyltransferase